MPTYTISATPLPATFRGTPQEFFDAMVDRMTVISDGAGFVISDTEPPGNQGPWLKEGSRWYTWSEDESSYVPLDLSDSINEQIHVGPTAPDFEADPEAPTIWLKTLDNTVVGIFYYFGSEVGWVTQAPELGPNVITTAMLQNASVTNVKLASGCVTGDKLADNLALSNLVKGSSREILRMNQSGTVLGYEKLFVRSDEEEFTAGDSQTINIIHGLDDQVPAYFRVVLVCKEDDAGFSQGVEVGAECLDREDHGEQIIIFADNVNVTVKLHKRPALRDPSTFVSANLDPTKWVLCAYVAPL